MEREYWTRGEILGVILQKEMTTRTPKECRQVLSVRGGRLRSRMFDFLHQGCWQEHKESKIEVTEARLIRPVTERTQEPHQQQRGQEGEVRDRDGRERFRSAHVAAVWRRREKACREREKGEVKNVQDVPKRQSAVVGPHVSRHNTTTVESSLVKRSEEVWSQQGQEDKLDDRRAGGAKKVLFNCGWRHSCGSV